MKEARPVFKKALLLTLAVYVVGVCLIQTNLNAKIGKLEHAAVHTAKAPVQGYDHPIMKKGGCCK